VATPIATSFVIIYLTSKSSAALQQVQPHYERKVAGILEYDGRASGNCRGAPDREIDRLVAGDNTTSA
jgi:hypothetical protein